MKKLFICLNALALSMYAGVAAYGKAVNENTAKTIGANCLISNGVQGVHSPSDISTAYVATATANGTLVTDYYVFNVIGAKGFVVVSADDQVIPILAYSGESSYDINHMSPDAKWWMNGYANQITYVIENNLAAKPGTAEQWSNLRVTKVNAKTAARTTSVAPLIHTTWNQEAPSGNYNMYCPTGTPTGCVATCMAEIMQYWNWPTVGCGSHTYNATGYGLQSADFGNTAYDWATMDANLTSSTTATALLMYHAGVAVNMDYTNTSAGSGAYVTNLESPIVNSAQYALVTYFHYKPTLQGYLRSGEPPLIAAIPDGTWVSMIEAELNASRPVMYSGRGSDGGHVWVCDGWNTGSGTGGVMFHFNFGWNGESNGYFSVDNVNPSALGVGGGGGNFNSDQSIIVGIEPDSFPNITGTLQLQANLNSTNSQPLGYGAPFSFSTKIKNTGSSSFSGNICAQVFDTSNNLMGTIQTLAGQTIAAGATSGTLTFASTSGMLNLLPEDYYHVQVMSQPAGSSSWTLVGSNGTYYNYNILDITNDTDMLLYSAIDVTSTLPVPLGGTITVFSQVQNNGHVNFSGNVEAVLVNISTGTSYTVQTLSSLPTGIDTFLYANFTFTGSVGSAPAGTYALEIKHQYNSTGSYYLTGNRFYDNPVLVHIGSGAGVSAVSALENSISVYPNPANEVININAPGVSVNEIRIVDVNGREVKKMDAGNQSQMSIPVSDLVTGVYFVQLQAGSDVATKKIVIAK